MDNFVDVERILKRLNAAQVVLIVNKNQPGVLKVGNVVNGAKINKMK